MKILDYTIRGNTPESSINERRSDFATKEDIYALQNKYAEIERKLAQIGGTNESAVQSNKQNKRK
jgi:type 1 glutamine amidotransferase